MRLRAVPAALVALLAAGCTVLPPEAAPPVIDVAAPQVTQREVIEIGRRDIETRQSINVNFGGATQRSLYFKAGGRLKALHAAPGQTVTEGQLLAELESGTLLYDVQLAEIDLERARIALERGQARAPFVDGPNETELKRLELDVLAAELRLEKQRSQLAETRLYAPFSGQVVSISAGVGDSVAAYADVMVLAGTGSVMARATIDEATATKLRPGQAALIYPNDGNPEAVRAKVVTVPQVGSRDKTLVIAPDEPSDRLRVGRNGRAELVLATRANALAVPLSAIRTFGGRKFVTVVEGEARREVAITTGLESDQYAEVLDGLEEGDRVVGR